MAADDQRAPGVLVWFEDNPEGRRALSEADVLARRRSVHLTVVAVATRERVIGCGRCLQGRVAAGGPWHMIVASQQLALSDPLPVGAD